jgi:hypothetical protein
VIRTRQAAVVRRQIEAGRIRLFIAHTRTKVLVLTLK